jgi:hypothetical protein
VASNGPGWHQMVSGSAIFGPKYLTNICILKDDKNTSFDFWYVCLFLSKLIECF